MKSILETIFYFLKMPLIFILYGLIILFSVFLPAKWVNKLIDTEYIEERFNSILNNAVNIKIIALVITIIIFVLLYS